MDAADDIAYSTYDIEDTFQAGFLSPSKILTFDPETMEIVAQTVGKQVGNENFDAKDVLGVFLDLFSQFTAPVEDFSPGESDSFNERVLSGLVHQQGLDAIAEDGHLRTNFTSFLVGRFINGVKVEIDEDLPQLSKVYVEPETLEKIEVLKHFTYQATIRSNRVAVSEFRGKDIIKDIFRALEGEKGISLLPTDFQALYRDATGNTPVQKRVLCDFIAGMTDRYAMEFWSRLYSDNGQTIFKPL